MRQTERRPPETSIAELRPAGYRTRSVKEDVRANLVRGIRVPVAPLAVVLLAACLGAGPGSCSAEERAAFDAIPHFEDRPLEAEDHATGGCAGRFTTTDPQAVIDHYTAELLAAGWEIGARGTQPDGTPVEMPPGILLAHKGEMSFGVEIPMAGGDRGTVTVLVGDGL